MTTSNLPSVSKLSRKTAASLVMAGLLASSTSVFAEHYATYPKVTVSDPAKLAQVKRGEYLAKAGDCIACHTDTTGGKPYSGGLPINTPFGTFYSPNITPDKDTGLGNWTDEEFINAMHNGIRPDGSNNYPVFPFLWYTKVSKQDLLDIRAYLNAIPAVKRENREPDVPFPFNLRFLQTFWKLMFFTGHKGEFKADPKQSAEWNRGAYLVEGLAHCGMCHTPINPLGGPKREYNLTGNMVDGMLAPNISGPALKDVPIEKILAVFKEDKMLSGGAVAGPMLEANKDSFQYLSNDDLKSIAVYIKSVQSKQPVKAKIEGTGLNAGKAVYESSCYACHDSGAAGAPKIGSATDWDPREKAGIDSLYKNAIVGIGAMPAKGNCSTCTDQQIKDAVDYIIKMSDAANASHEVTVGRPDTPMKPLTMAEGKAVYSNFCSTCHATGKMGAPVVGDKAAWATRITQGMPTLFEHAIVGYNKMPANGNCSQCNNAQVKAAVKYMVQQSKSEGDYSLW